jgi:hypothetical protein
MALCHQSSKIHVSQAQLLGSYVHCKLCLQRRDVFACLVDVGVQRLDLAAEFESANTMAKRLAVRRKNFKATAVGSRHVAIRRRSG